MDINVTDGEAYDRVLAKKASDKLLALLHYHHDARMVRPKDWKPKQPWIKEVTLPPPVAPIEPRVPLIDEIQRAVAFVFKVSRAELLSSRRTKDIVLPRHVAVYLAKELTPNSLPAIGRKFGGRDHTSILFATLKIKRLLASDEDLATRVAAVKSMLGGAFA